MRDTGHFCWEKYECMTQKKHWFVLQIWEQFSGPSDR